jgi:signal transduction histidine kinase
MTLALPRVAANAVTPVPARVLGICAFWAAMYVAYRQGMSFDHASASPVWLPASILLCGLLASRPSSWWILLLGTLPIRLFTPAAQALPAWYSVAAFSINSAGAVIGALALRRFNKDPLRFETLREFGTFFLWIVVLVPAVSALAGAAARRALGYDYWSVWAHWFMDNALAQVVVTPAIFYWVFRRSWKLKAETRRWMEMAFLGFGILFTSYMAFSKRAPYAEPRFYLPVPFLFWAAIRFGMEGATGTIAVLGSLSVAAALTGCGPFAGHPPEETARALQHFLLLRAIPLYVIAILVEQRSRAEQQVQQQRDEMAYLSRVAVLGELSGSLAHELNQPLAAILTNAQTARRHLERGSADPRDLREILDDIITDDRRAGEIIRGLRRLFQRGVEQQRPLDMNLLVREALKLAQGELQRTSVELRTDLPDLPAVRGDRVQLQQVLLNLLTNACNAMSDVPAPDRRLTVRTSFRPAEGVCVTVSDRGHGIVNGDLPRLFDPFFTTRQEGMGLGLTVCRSIIGAHRGRLWAENNSDRGASFHFVVPEVRQIGEPPGRATITDG